MDPVERILQQWRAERPDLDTSPMGVLGRLSRATAAADERLSSNFAIHGIDAATFDVLATLLRQGSPYRLTPSELASEAMITSSAVAQRLNRLDALGLITRTPNPHDARGKLVVLTSRGKDVVDRVLPDHLAAEESVLAPLDASERDLLAALLARLISDTPAAH